MAVSSHNGNNESFIGNSSLVDLSFYDENTNEVQIRNTSIPIDFIIERDKNVLDFSSSLQYVNATDINSQLENSLFLMCSFIIKSNNASIHIELKPIQSNISYIMVVKFGQLPIINSTYSDFTSFKIFCQSKILLICFMIF